MFATLLFASCMFAGDGSATEADVRMAAVAPPEVAIASAIAEARSDFEARYEELGLVGSAPLAGTEDARKAETAARHKARTEHAREAGKRETQSRER